MVGDNKQRRHYLRQGLGKAPQGKQPMMIASIKRRRKSPLGLGKPQSLSILTWIPTHPTVSPCKAGLTMGLFLVEYERPVCIILTYHESFCASPTK